MSAIAISIIAGSIWAVIGLGAYFYPALIQGKEASDEWSMWSMFWPFFISFWIIMGCVIIAISPFIGLSRLQEKLANKVRAKQLLAAKMKTPTIDIKIEEPKQLHETNYRSMNCSQCGHELK